MTSRARLITIPLSHYCEKARWALDRAALPYREEPHAPLLHLLATKYVGGGTVPLLIHGGKRFTDSKEIMLYANEVSGVDLLYPREVALRREVDLLEQCFDDELGPHARRWAYAHLLPHGALLRSVWSRHLPWFEAGLVPIVVPIARPLVRRLYKIAPQDALYSLEKSRSVFEQVDKRLNEGRRYLVGERFTAADLTFAALAAPLLFPVECRAAHPALDAVPAAMREEVLRLRATNAGRHALRLFSQER